jgi:putative DNA primase/helicase
VNDLRAIARALRGEVSGSQVLAPGPGHGPRDRSLSVKLSSTAPDGFLCHSFAGDPWDNCRDHVMSRLGLRHEPRAAPCRHPMAPPPPAAAADSTASALAIWRQGVDLRGTLAERYLASRGLVLEEDLAGDVLRWHPGIGDMVALFRNIATDEPQAVSRTYLDRKGKKLGRKFLGRVGGAAIKLDPDENVLGGLHIGEGLETCMAARQLGLRPCWALGSAGALAAFPVLNGIEFLTLLVDHDANGVGEKSAREAEMRWRSAGREARLFRPNALGDFNDITEAAR